MTSSETPVAKTNRTLLWVAGAVVVVAALYTAGWFYVAGTVEARAARALERLNANGASAECTSRQAHGFPFRVGLSCAAISFGDAQETVDARGNGFRTAARILDPFQIVGELDEGSLEFPLGAMDYGARATDIRFSGRLTEALPEAFSFAARSISVDENPESAGLSIVLDAESAEAHMRRSGDDLEVALNGTGVTISPPGLDRPATIPRLDADLMLKDGARIAENPPQSLRGMSFELRNASLSTDDDAGFTVSGPLSIDDEGRIDATLQLSVRKPKKFAAFVAGIVPEMRNEIQSAFSGLALLGDDPSLPLRIVKGRARIAFITLGDIPPVR